MPRGYTVDGERRALHVSIAADVYALLEAEELRRRALGIKASKREIVEMAIRWFVDQAIAASTITGLEAEMERRRLLGVPVTRRALVEEAVRAYLHLDVVQRPIGS